MQKAIKTRMNENIVLVFAIVAHFIKVFVINFGDFAYDDLCFMLVILSFWPLVYACKQTHKIPNETECLFISMLIQYIQNMPQCK